MGCCIKYIVAIAITLQVISARTAKDCVGFATAEDFVVAIFAIDIVFTMELSVD